MTADDYAENPTPRMLAAESRREFRRLLDASSLGTPGAKALIKHGRGEELTSEEAEAMDAEMARLDDELRRAP